MINKNISSDKQWGHPTDTSDWWFRNVTNEVQYTGNNQPHNNLPPYLAIFIWKRTS